MRKLDRSVLYNPIDDVIWSCPFFTRNFFSSKNISPIIEKKWSLKLNSKTSVEIDFFLKTKKKNIIFGCLQANMI